MKSSTFLELYSIPQDEPDRWFAGDIHLRRLVRRLLQPFRNAGANGLARVGINLSLGLSRLDIPHRLHTKYVRPRAGAQVGILHAPIRLAKNIAREHRCVIGPGVLNMPEEWPDMFLGTKVQAYLQACEWQGDVFRRIFKSRVKIWPVGIDTDRLAPLPTDVKKFDFLVYDKRRWPNAKPAQGLLNPLLDCLKQKNLSWSLLTYGKYPRAGKKGGNLLHEMARQAKAMLFLCENETQGIAYNEVLSLDVPILAWDQGFWQDPVRLQYGLQEVPATSVPYWDKRCGLIFNNVTEFSEKLDKFLLKIKNGYFRPRQYVTENLGLRKRTEEYLSFFCPSK